MLGNFDGIMINLLEYIETELTDILSDINSIYMPLHPSENTDMNKKSIKK